MTRHWWICLLAVIGCSDDPAAPEDLVPVDRVDIAVPPNRDLLLGDTMRLSVVALSASGDTLRGRQIEWATSDASTISITPGGLLSGIAAGQATITATIEGQSASAILATIALNFTAVSAGGYFTCGLTTLGKGWCWGSNSSGELGIGIVDPDRVYRTPQPVAVGEGFASISAGYVSSCALSLTGQALCWGSNENGQLGDGSKTTRPAPTPIAGGLVFGAIGGPNNHTCAVTAAGAGYCWGANEYGALGEGTRTERLLPTAVTGGLSFSELSVNWSGTCGRAASGDAFCWGVNYSGQLGYDTTYYNVTPVAVAGNNSFSQLSAGNSRGCGLTSAGSVMCWGFKRFHHAGKLSYVPMAEPGSTPFVSVSEGTEHACGLTAQGAAYCWGANSYGELGTGVRGDLSVEYPPTPVAGGLTFIALSAGDFRTCGIATGGAAYCWGDNWAGTLGTGLAPDAVLAPAPVQGGLVLTGISAGDNHSCAIATDGAMYCWGYNQYGVLGDGTTSSRTTPALVSGGLTFQTVVTGSYHTCGLSSGAAYCWGSNNFGHLGDGTNIDRLTPVPVTGGHTFTRLALGQLFTCGVDTGGVAHCWGRNYHGSLGDGSETDRPVPAAVVGGLQFSDIALGEVHACGLTSSGAAHCWGDNLEGQLGNDVHPDSPLPLKVQGGLVFTSVMTGGGGSCGLTAVGEAYCWPGSFNNSAPAAVPGGIHFSTLSIGETHACGVTPNGEAYCWGRNNYGQLGNGAILNYGVVQRTPAPVTGGMSWAQISAGAEHTCGLTLQGVLYCWGQNYYGQLGVAGYDEAGGVPFPVKVRGQP